MRYRETLVAWNPGTPQVRVGRLLERGEPDWTRHPINYRMTGGAAYRHVRECEDASKLVVLLFADWHAIVVRDRVPIEVAHKAFLAIDEYRRHIAPDIPGADPG